uniref:Uncharacterized protein n=3 Tax=Brassica TaxID=3705 RepID=A0A0D3ECK8_BRAOL
MIWLRYMGASIEEHTIMNGLRSYPLIDVRDSSVAKQRPGLRRIGRGSVATTEWIGRSLHSDRLVRGPVATWRPCLDHFLTSLVVASSEKMARKQFQQAKTGELVSRLNVFHEMSERNHVSSWRDDNDKYLKKALKSMDADKYLKKVGLWRDDMFFWKQVGDTEAIEDFVAKGGMVGTRIGPKGIVESEGEADNYQKEMEKKMFDEEAQINL